MQKGIVTSKENEDTRIVTTKKCVDGIATTTFLMNRIVTTEKPVERNSYYLVNGIITTNKSDRRNSYYQNILHTE